MRGPQSLPLKRLSQSIEHFLDFFRALGMVQPQPGHLVGE
jgi:hypothetical protein